MSAPHSILYRYGLADLDRLTFATKADKNEIGTSSIRYFIVEKLRDAHLGRQVKNIVAETFDISAPKFIKGLLSYVLTF